MRIILLLLSSQKLSFDEEANHHYTSCRLCLLSYFTAAIRTVIKLTHGNRNRVSDAMIEPQPLH